MSLVAGHDAIDATISPGCGLVPDAAHFSLQGSGEWRKRHRRRPGCLGHSEELAPRCPMIAQELSFQRVRLRFGPLHFAASRSTSARPRGFDPWPSGTTQQLGEMIGPHFRVAVTRQQPRIDAGSGGLPPSTGEQRTRGDPLGCRCAKRIDASEFGTQGRFGWACSTEERKRAWRLKPC